MSGRGTRTSGTDTETDKQLFLFRYPSGDGTPSPFDERWPPSWVAIFQFVRIAGAGRREDDRARCREQTGEKMAARRRGSTGGKMAACRHEQTGGKMPVSTSLWSKFKCNFHPVET